MYSSEDTEERVEGSQSDWDAYAATDRGTSGIGEYRMPSASAFSAYEAGTAVTIGIFVIILAALILYAQ